MKKRILFTFYSGDKIYVFYHDKREGETVKKLMKHIDGELVFHSDKCG